MWPPGLKATEVTVSGWPVSSWPKARARAGSATSHRRTAWSSPPLARVRPSGANATEVTSTVEVRVKVYALRTGKLVSDRKLQINGASCPYSIFCYGGPPSYRSVTPSDADVRDAFGPLVGR